MKNPKSLIIKIALGVAAVAFIFSVVTLIRNIVVGAMVFVSVMQVIGAGVIVVICFAMFRIFSGMPAEDEEDEEDEDQTESQTSESDTPQPAEPFPKDFGIDDFAYDHFPEPASDGDGYDLNLFDE